MACFVIKTRVLNTTPDDRAVPDDLWNTHCQWNRWLKDTIISLFQIRKGTYPSSKTGSQATIKFARDLDTPLRACDQGEWNVRVGAGNRIFLLTTLFRGLIIE
jgi:hypothetical protein